MQDKYISLAHGNGGRYMHELIRDVFAHHLDNDCLDISLDGAVVPSPGSELVFTTDGFTVQPLEFPGGDIGSLAVHGTVNDLAVSGATPLYLSLNAFIEEGTEITLLDRIVQSLADAARSAGVKVVAGDTKVLRRGEGGGIYLATSGIGRREGTGLSLSAIQGGDRILVSGPVGDHGIAVMLAREAFGLRGDIRSDCASVLPLTRPVAAWQRSAPSCTRQPVTASGSTSRGSRCGTRSTRSATCSATIRCTSPARAGWWRSTRRRPRCRASRNGS